MTSETIARRGARVASTGWRFFLASRPLHVAVLAVFFAGWALHAIGTYNDPLLGGLFRWIGIDFGFFYAHAQVFAHGDLAGLYSLDAAAPYRDALAAYSTSPAVAMPPGPVPFPPIYAWLISPMALIPAPLAFAIWTAINAVAAIVLAWRAANFFPPERRLLAGGLALVSTSVMFSLWFGQPQLFLAVAFGEAFIAFGRGQDRAAGLWLAVILFKPQYLLLILLILLWKRRRNAIAGLAAGGLVIFVASILVAGPATFGEYITSLIDSATASGGALLTAVSPNLMVNWRALVLAVPLLPDMARVAITLVLSGLTVLAVVVAWRGPWLASATRFAGQMTLLAVGTILTAWHSHIHGVAMMVVPLAAFLASGLGRGAIDRAIGVTIRLIVGAAIVAPWLWFTVLDRSHTEANRMVAIALVCGFILLFVLLVRREGEPATQPIASRAAVA